MELPLNDTPSPAKVNYLQKTIPFYPRPFATIPVSGSRPTVQKALEQVRDGKWKAVISRLRAEKNEKTQKALKKELGAFVFGFNFPDRKPREYESAVDALECSWLVTVDYDNIKNPKATRDRLGQHRSVVGAFVSPRGNGVKCLVAWTGVFGPEGYTAAWKNACRALDKIVGAPADHNGKDMTRICYPSWDPGCYTAPAGKVIVPVKGVPRVEDDPLLATPARVEEEVKPVDERMRQLERLEWEDAFAKVKERLEWIDPAFADDRDGWVKVCFAVVATLGHRPETRELLSDWSQGLVRHDDASHPEGCPATYGSDKDFEIAWKSFRKKPNGRPAGLGSLTAVAKEGGWTLARRERSSEGRSWEDALLRNEHGAVKTVHVNCSLIMEHVEGFAGLLKWNELRQQVEWHGEPGYARTGKDEVWLDSDSLDLARYLSKLYQVAWVPKMIDEVVGNVARARSYHPVRDYLNGLVWDGQERLATWLAGAFGVKTTSYTKSVGRKWMISAVARAMRPGCKVDTMLILEGFQGRKKSTGFRALAGDKWFSDAQLVIGDKDGMMLIQKVWIHELPEMHTHRKAEADLMKSFMSRQTDEYREPFGRVIVERPRGVVFVGTTNESKYLKDPTGNRRFWPVAGSKVNVGWIKANRDQLWAEAKVAFDLGEPWWLEEEEEEGAVIEQSKRLELDPWEDALSGYLARQSSRVVASGELLHMALEMKNPTSMDARRLAGVMRRLGWVGPRKVSVNKRQVSGFTYPDL